MENLPVSSINEATVKHLPLKRIFDISFSLFVLLFTFPILLLIAFSIKLTSKGSILYHQERIGRGGKAFKCLKFRTMYSDADKRLKIILEKNPKMKKEWEENFKLKNDPRITFFGRFLRKTSLDELPQFWNVLMGDLSVVGPRPVVIDEIITFYGTRSNKILSIRPGITGMWQVSGRNDTSYHHRILLDEKYVEEHSFILDLKIILKTIPSMIFAKGAY